MLLRLLEFFWTSIPTWGLVLLSAAAALSFGARFWGVIRGWMFARPWQSIGIAGSLMGFALLYVALTLGEGRMSVAMRGGSVRLLLAIHCVGILHFNWDYIRLALHRGRP